MEAQKSGMPYFSYQSLLLSTIVLNDEYAVLQIHFITSNGNIS